MKKIKIVHLVPMLSPGGAERVAVHILRGLDRKRYEPALISFTPRLDCELDRLLEDDRVKVRYLGKHAGFDFRVYSRLHRALTECQPDIVHSHLHVLRYAFPCLMLVRPAVILHTVHNLATREIEPRLRWLQRYALHHGVVPIAVADEVAASLQHLYGIPACRVISNGIPTDSYACPPMTRREWRANEGFGERDFLFVCVARFAPQKNHSLLLQAFAQVATSSPYARLVLVGEGVLTEQLRRQAEALGIDRRIHFLGLRDDIPDVLGAMDVFVLSSDWEGHPLSIIEAMAAGLPIVSTRVGGVPEMIEDGKHGLIVPVGDFEALSKSMRFLENNREARKSLGTAGALRAKERFDASVMVRAYEDLYESLIVQRQASPVENMFRKATMPA